MKLKENMTKNLKKYKFIQKNNIFYFLKKILLKMLFENAIF